MLYIALFELPENLEELIQELIEKKPELTREAIEALIRDKKEKIGAGYLTDEGAIFLIASDYNVRVSEPVKTAMSIKDLVSGVKEVSLLVRVLGIGPVKQFTKKDGSLLSLRIMIVYEAPDVTTIVKLWDEKARLEGIDDIKPGDLIKIMKAYVKSDYDGTPTINIGSSSSIEPADVAQKEESRIPGIEQLVKDVGETEEGERNIAVVGTIDGMISVMSYTSQKGRPSTALKMRLKGANDSAMRIVIWGKDESSVPSKVPQSAKVRLYGVNVKGGNQGVEIHGSDATSIVIEGAGSLDEIEAIPLRILSKPDNLTDDNNRPDSKKRWLLAIGKNKMLYTITDTEGMTDEHAEGDVVEIMPAKVHGTAITLDDSSLVRGLEDDGNISTLSDARTKLEDVKPEGYYCVEGIIIKTGDRREIQTKNGSIVALSDMYIEDASSRMWIKGWRNQARIIDQCELGQKVSITGLNARLGLEGQVDLTLTPYSKITNVQG